MSGEKKSVYTIAAGIPFARTLVEKLLDDCGDNPEQLADILILLPTRRACRVVREAFLSVSNGQALILPRLQAIGDVDEEDLSLNIAGQGAMDNILDLPPSISPLKRQLLLARLIHSAELFSQGFDHALVLANALGRFMDQIYTENLDIADLANLVPDDFAEHWQITLDFLEIISQSWPQILKEQNVIDIADRRNRLILALGEYWQTTKPQTQIIAAGTTGSIPAVAHLLSVIASLPNGQVILPGLDQELDEKSWDEAEETHPQFGFKQLLQRMNINRKDVQAWPCKIPAINQARRALVREIMRPAETTDHWTTLNTNSKQKTAINAALENLKIAECEDENEEAQLIAIMMREILEAPKRTAALITPDRQLARRVSAAMKRWDVTLDDSAGKTLDQTYLGSFFNLITQACLQSISPISLLSLLKHECCRCVTNREIEELELNFLRGPKPAAGFDPLFKKVQQHNNSDLNAALETLQNNLSDYLKLNEERHNFKDLLTRHIKTAESLSLNNEDLWINEEGEALSNLFSNLLEHAHYMPDITMETYNEILLHVMKAVTVRPKYGTHPRLMILGQLEARLIDADLVIMAGLNENSWPPDAGHDPWLSRPMRLQFGLPAHERSVGLAAHDFVQGFCNTNTVITRALQKSGAPTIPARWLQRLDTVLEAANIDQENLKSSQQLHWARTLNQPAEFIPCARPAPKPPSNTRPNKIPATQIETWLKDPYGIYARYVLNLKALKPIEQDTDAALRGTILHDTLDDFVSTYPKELPESAQDILLSLAHENLQKHEQNQEDWQFWWPRFERMAQWYINHEYKHRQNTSVLKTEITGAITLENVTITARADRIDKTAEGTILIDYKSAGTYSKKSMHTGEAPQLPVEGLIVEQGGFDGIPPKVSALEYWVLSGKSSEAGKIVAETQNIQDLIDTTRDNITNLIKAYSNKNTPYISIPRQGYEPRFSDYEHLARIKEWSTSENDEAA